MKSMHYKKCVYIVIVILLVVSTVSSCSKDSIVVRGDYLFNEDREILVEELSDHKLSLANFKYGDAKVLSLPEMFDDKRPIVCVNEQSFMEIDNMEELIIPDSYQQIYLFAFANCKNLKVIRIGKGVDFIEHCAFMGCNSIERIEIDSANQTYLADNDNGCIVEKGRNALVFGYGKRIIPSTVQIIAQSAFSRDAVIKNLSIPNTIKEIEHAAFYASALSEVKIPDSVTKLGICAFSRCDSLRKVFIDMEGGIIEKEIFNECHDITIYCAAKEKPDTWDDRWLDGCINPTVIWDYSGETNDASA